MSVFQPIQQDKTASEVAHQIEGLVLEGVLRSGDQLPPERDLALEMGVSRPVLRDAIQLLETKQILHRKQGDGTFVCEIIGQIFTSPIASLLPNHKKATLDYLEYRREIEAITAMFAAQRATKYDLNMLQNCIDRMQDAHLHANFELEGEIDVEFHSLIGEMAHNLVLLHTLRSCYRLLSAGVMRNRSQLYEKLGGREALFQQHLAIAKAIMNRDPEAARSASVAHIDYIMGRSADLEKEMERERVSELRFNQRDATGNRRYASKK